MSVKFSLEGSGAGAVKAVQDLNNALQATEKNSEGAARSTKRLEEQARRLAENADPQLKYNNRIAELAQHVEAGRIKIEQATKVAERYGKELFEASEEGKKAAAAAVNAAEQQKRAEEGKRKSLQATLEAGRRIVQMEKERAAAAEQAAREEKQLVDAAQKIREAISPQEKLNRLYRELGQHVKAGRLTMDEATAAATKYRMELTGASVEARKGIASNDFVNSLAATASGYLSIATAIGVVISAMKQHAEEKERAAQKAIQSRAGLGSLSQLAATSSDPEARFASLVAEARGFVSLGAAVDENEAGALVFELASAGLNRRDREFAAQVRAAGTLQNVGGAAQAYDALKTALGEGEVGNFQEFLSKSLQAAAVAPGSFEQLPIAVAQAGGSAKQLGISDEFLLAAGAILAKTTGSPSEGGTQLEAFLKQAEKSGLKDIEGIGGIALLEKISALPERQQGFGGVLGDRAEAIAGYRTLARPENMALLRELEGRITAAQQGNLAGQAAGLPDTDEQLRAARNAAQSSGALDVAKGEAFSSERNLINTIRNERRKRFLREGRTTALMMDEAFDSLTDWTGLFGGQSEIEVAAQNKDLYSPQTQRQIEEYMRRLAESNENIDRRERSRITTRPE